MRIAQFTESYVPVINGAAVAVDLLARELARHHHVEVFAPQFPGHADNSGPPVRRFPSYTAPGHGDYPLAVPFSPAIFRRFRKAGFDVVHTHSPFALGRAGRRWARRCGIPLVTTYHTLYEKYAHYTHFLPQGPVSRLLREISARYCGSCDRVVVPTEPIREVLLGYGVRRPIHVIPTGLRLAPPQPEDPAFPRRALGIPLGAPVVLYAGRLAKEKNLELLFEGWSRVARGAPEAWLLVVGSGPNEGEARQLGARSGAPERIAFAGFIPPERMPAAYAAAAVFAFSSLSDTQGLVLTEAKAAGVPAVSVNSYGPGVVVKNGVDGLLTGNDPDEFGAALLRLIRDPDLRRRMSEAALLEARRFSIEETVANYERVYEEALRGGGMVRE